VNRRVDHDTAVNVDFNDLAFLLVKAHALVEAVIHASERDKLLTSLD